MEVVNMSSRALKNLHTEITAELTRRQDIMQESCEHPKWTSIMYMRPGATYTGCSICGKAKHTLEPKQAQQEQ